MKYLSLFLSSGSLVGAVAIGLLMVKVVEGVQELGERLDDLENKTPKPRPQPLYNSDGTPYIDTAQIVEQNMGIQNVAKGLGAPNVGQKFVREEDVS